MAALFPPRLFPRSSVSSSGSSFPSALSASLLLRVAKARLAYLPLRAWNWSGSEQKQ